MKIENQNNIEQALDNVWHLINQRIANKALEACRQLVLTFPESDEAWFAQSFLYFQLSKGQDALASIEQAVKYSPNNIQWLTHKAHCYYMLTDIALAKETLQPVINQYFNKPKATITLSEELSPELLSELALVLNKLVLHKQAEFFYQQAISSYLLIKNTSENYLSSLYFNLASIQRYLGKINCAITSLNKALQLNPLDCEAQLLRSSLAKQNCKNNHIDQLQSLITQNSIATKKVPMLGKIQLHYALAKELEDTKQYQQSFQSLQSGAHIRRQHMQYDVKQDTNTLEKIIQVFDANLFNNKSIGYNDNRPIFILGLPRTGSTLVDRILSSHSKVTSAGELNDFAMQMMDQCKKTSPKQPSNRLALIELTATLNVEKLGQAYSEKTREYGIDGTHFIDKLPLNSLYVGLIHLALPQAKIIHVKRNPMDTCYAIFKQLFTQGYPFSYDLNELGQYVIAHEKMMAHWHRILPHAIYQINYEDLVASPQQQTKQLLDYCQLNWQDNCLNFHQNNEASTTASASQVRQPIYSSSLHKWRNYQQALQPLQQQLSQAGLI